MEGSHAIQPRLEEASPAEFAARRRWDVIVIGAGMGGGMAGRRLAEHGLSVLFVEKGPIGYPSEAQFLKDEPEDHRSRQKLGYWPAKIEAHVDGGPPARFFAPLGCGVGGTSVFYAAALERPERHDLESVTGLAHPTGGWPVGFDAFLPYLIEAEDLLSVRGEADPLSDLPGPRLPAPALTPQEAKMFDDLRRSGLHPYRAHEAIRRVRGCDECLGRKCPWNCKMDGRSAGVEPALETGRVHLLADCSVEELIESGGSIAQLRVRVGGSEYRLSADIVVLAAGALHSPRLLLGSTGVHPEGCGNSSGWVGRGLMFHLNELVALWPRRGSASPGATRSLSFRDLYTVKGQRLGLVQSMGVKVDAGLIAAYLKGALKGSALGRLPGIGPMATVTSVLAAKVLGNATVLVGLMEDLPYFENRVTVHPTEPDCPVIEYRLSWELRRRRSLFRREMRARLGRVRTMPLGLGPTLNFGHPSGTLRFGSDAATSVLDADCRAHDLDNLFVADASFMPTSMGVNPSLMIAANALRVADVVAARLKSSKRKVS